MYCVNGPAMQRQNMQQSDIKPGDAVFFNTGWGSLWMKDNNRFNSGEPGIGLEVAREQGDMTIEYSMEGGVATISLNRPEVRNALNL